VQPDYVRVIDGDAAALAEFLTGDTWPFHAGPPVDRETVLRRAADGHYAHYRDGWPSADGTMHDAVGYATLRRDWLTGTVTPVPWGS